MDARLEFVVVDDASTDGTAACLAHSAPDLEQRENIKLRIFRLEKRSGVPAARNWGAMHACADLLFITDAHVRPSPGWDRIVLQQVRPKRVLAATISQRSTGFLGYGCRLATPVMGTYWNKGPFPGISPVQIAACAGAAISRELFMRLGGYDCGMPIYGGAEPEFSVRAWLQGAEVMVLPTLLVEHRFKPQSELRAFVEETRAIRVHNSLRFGLLYLSDLACLQLVRYFASRFPDEIAGAMKMIADSDVWQRRRLLEARRERSFNWFVKRFGIKDEAGPEIL
jgi:glycosyltransferase involved in cell wall biosynthesis